MTRIALDSVVAAQAYLAYHSWPKAVGNFPGVLVLKRANVTVDTWTAASPTDFAALCDEYFRIDGAPDKSKPYYFPMRGWRHRNWPRGDVYTRFKDTSPLPKLQYLESRGVQDSWEWRFVVGYEQVLPKYVGDAGVPLLELAAWMYRDAEWPEDATAEHVTARFLAEFNIAEAERRLLFSSKSSLDAARLFGESWEQDSLLVRLPSPSTPSEPAATLKVVGSEAPSDYGLDTLVDELQLDSESVQLWLASIERKGQAVFYGPARH